MRINSKVLMASTAVSSCLFLSFTAVGAGAYDAEDNENVYQLEEVIVTATKTSRSMQDVPVAVSSLDGNSLKSGGINNVYDLTAAAPSLSISRNKGSANVFLRGIGNAFVDLGVDASVAFHQDGVYVARPRAQISSFFDVERVEILRGPQGTLYGRNATGGSINVITRAPSSETEATARLTYGSKNLMEFEGGIGGALSDTVNGRLASYASIRDGFGTNVVTGNDIMDKEEFGVRGKLEWIASDSVSVLFSGDYWRADDAAFGMHYFEQAGPALPFLGYQPGADDPADFHDIASEDDFVRDAEIYGFSVEVKYEVSPNVSLKSLTGYRHSSAAGISDVDGAGDGGALNYAFLRELEISNSLSEELQIDYIGDSLRVIAGVYLFSEEIDGNLSIPLNGPNNTHTQGRQPGVQGTDEFYQDGSLETDAYAAFLNVEYDVSDKLTLIVGGRYSYEKKISTGDFHLESAAIGLDELPVRADFEYEDSWNDFSPRAVVQYHVTDDLNFYGSVTKGFKSGTFAIGADSGAASPEEVLSYEIGGKATLLDGRVQTNFAIFYNDYEDLQVQVFEGGGPVIVNAASAKIKGFELEAKTLLTQDISFDFGYGYLDATYNDFLAVDSYAPPGSPLVDLTGNNLVNAPKHTFTAALTGDMALGDWGTGTFRADYRYASRIYFGAFNREAVSQKAVGILNLRFTVVPDDSNWSYSVWGRNITDEEVRVGASALPPFLSSAAVGPVAPPLHFGFDVNYRF